MSSDFHILINNFPFPLKSLLCNLMAHRFFFADLLAFRGEIGPQELPFLGQKLDFGQKGEKVP